MDNTHRWLALASNYSYPLYYLCPLRIFTMTKQKIFGWDGSEASRPKHIRSLRAKERRKVDARLLDIPAFTSKAQARSVVLDPNTKELEIVGDDASIALLNAMQHRGQETGSESLVAPVGLAYGDNSLLIHVVSPTLSITPTVTGDVDTWTIAPSPTASIVFSPASGRLSGLTTLSPGDAPEVVVITAANEAGTDFVSVTLTAVSP